MSIDCVICLEQVENEDILRLDCGHIFHNECIENWSKVSGKINNNSLTWVCPLCRQSYNDLIEDEDEDENITMYYLTLTKFNKNRKFIQFVTLIDFLFSFLIITNGNIYNSIYCICSLFGFYGSTMLKTSYLTLYYMFCILSFLIKMVSITNFFYITNYSFDNSIIDTINVDDTFHLTIFFLSTLLQLYISIIVYKLCSQINKYDEVIRRTHFYLT